MNMRPFPSIGALILLHRGGSRHAAAAAGTTSRRSHHRRRRQQQQSQIGAYASADRPPLEGEKEDCGDERRQRLRPHATAPLAATTAGTDANDGESKSSKSSQKSSVDEDEDENEDPSRTASPGASSPSPSPPGVSPAASAAGTTAPSSTPSEPPTTPSSAPTGKSGKSKKETRPKAAKGAKSRTTTRPRPPPSSSPTGSPVVGSAAATVAPTLAPPNATYYDSFEAGTFPDGDDEWSVMASSSDDDDGRDDAFDSDFGSRGRSLVAPLSSRRSPYWALTSDEARTGAYSIGTPDLNDRTGDGDIATRRRASNVTLATDDSGAGVLSFSLLSNVKHPVEDVSWYVDGVLYDRAPPTTMTTTSKTVGSDPPRWTERRIILGEGAHEVTWEYVYDPGPRTTGEVGEIEAGGMTIEPSYVDDVYFVPGGGGDADRPTPFPSVQPTTTASPASPAPATEGPTSSSRPTMRSRTPASEGPTWSATTRSQAPATAGPTSTASPTTSSRTPATGAPASTASPTMRSQGPASEGPTFPAPPTMRSQGPATGGPTSTASATTPSRTPATGAPTSTTSPTMRSQGPASEGPASTEAPTMQSPAPTTEGPASTEAPTMQSPAPTTEGPASTEAPTTPSRAPATEGPASTNAPMTRGPAPATEGPASSEAPTTRGPAPATEGPASTEAPMTPSRAPATEGPASFDPVSSESPVVRSPAPTPDALYYDSFERATFPNDPEWSVATSEDDDAGTSAAVHPNGGRLLEEEGRSAHWALTSDEALTGARSIEGPDLSGGGDLAPRSAYVTLATGDDWGSGVLHFSALWDLVGFEDNDLRWYVDGDFDDWVPEISSSASWKEFRVRLGPGGHNVTWRWMYNPDGVLDEPRGAGAAFVDDVYFTPVDEFPTQSPSTYLPTALSITPTSSQRPTYARDNMPTELVPSPACVAGYTCLQNRDFGVEDASKFDIDLSIEVLDPTYADAFVGARSRWMELIVGDLPSMPRDSIGNADPCVNDFPDAVDDLHVCGRDAIIDGEGGVLGLAGPLWGRQDPATGRVTAVTGRMSFDVADVPGMVADGTWEGVILHEMGHVAGIGTIWKFNGLVDDDLNYLGGHAVDVWVDDWGCSSAAPPVERDGGDGTAGGHWDEDCLRTELMTGYAEGGGADMPVSALTVASLRDVGYGVNYTAADAYDGRDAACCFLPSFVSMSPSPPSRPPLSDLGRAAAVAHGRQVLSENQRPRSIVDEELESAFVYFGDLLVVVLVEENGHVYDVLVTKE